jgi:hypothetical protein
MRKDTWYAGCLDEETFEAALKIDMKPILAWFEKTFVFLFLLSLCVPLSKSFGSGAWTRIYVFDFFLFPMLVLWAIRLFSYEKKQIKLNVADVLFLLFLIWLFICDIHGSRPSTSFGEWLVFARCFFTYLYFSRNVDSFIPLRYIVVLLGVLLFIEGILAFFQHMERSNIGQINSYFGHGHSPRQRRLPPRATGTFINPNILGGWVMVMLPIILSWALSEKKKLGTILLLTAFTAGSMGLAATLSRSKLVFAFVGIAIVLFWYRSLFYGLCLKNKKKGLVLLAVLFFVSGCFGVLVYSGVGKQILTRFAQLSSAPNFDRKSLQRELAFELMKTHPVFGVGQGNFGIFNKDKYPYYYRGKKRDKKKIANKGPTCHNIPMKIGSESGFLGLFLFISFLSVLIFNGWRRVRNYPENYGEAIRGGACIGFVTVILDMQWNTVFTHYSFMPLFFVLVGISFSKDEV